MPYQYETTDTDYTHFSSGRVFYGVPGVPALPVRLTCEVFKRCKALHGVARPVTLYDPCCGAAYHLSTLAYLCWDDIQTIYASDIDPQALDGARKNLALLTAAGLDRRIREIQTMLQKYGKSAHSEALNSAYWLKEHLSANLQKHPIQFDCFQADVTIPPAAADLAVPADIILADIPYGWHAAWKTTQTGLGADPLWAMLDFLLPKMEASSILAIFMDKSQKVSHPAYKRIQALNFGKRHVMILRKSRAS